jgi:hypothetical protein
MIQKTIILITSIIIAGCASIPKTQKYLGLDVYDKKFIISDGKTLFLPVTSVGAIPIEDENYAIEVAGVITGSKEKNKDESILIYTFVINSKNYNELQSIQIEQVYPNKKSKLLILDNSPVDRFSFWDLSTIPFKIKRANMQPFYKKEETTVVFKISVKETNGKQFIYYQPSSVFVKSRNTLNQHLAKNIIIDNTSDLTFKNTFNNIHKTLSDNDKLKFELACLIIFSNHYGNKNIPSFNFEFLKHRKVFQQLFADKTYEEIVREANVLMNKDINLKLQIMMLEIKSKSEKLGVIHKDNE